MSSPLHDLVDYLSKPEVVARAVQRETDAPVPPPTEVDWQPDPFGPDPLYQDAAPDGTLQLIPSAEVAPHTPASRGWWRAAVYGGGAVVAASLPVALGAVVGQRGGREVAFAAGVTARQGEVRGPGRAVELTVENRSPRNAFVTVVGVNGARSPVVSDTGTGFIDLGPRQSRPLALPATFDELSAAVVVLTATPAGEAIVKGLDAAALPVDPAAARDRVAADLARFGFEGAAVELVRLRP